MMKTMTDVIKALEGEVDRALAEHARPKGGMSVPFHGDFAYVQVSALRRLKWWIRELRAAAERDFARVELERLQEGIRARMRASDACLGSMRGIVSTSDLAALLEVTP